MTRGVKGPSVCSVEGCNGSKRISRGLCQMHYARLMRHGSVGGSAKQHAVSWAGKACQVDGCDSPVKSKGYCLAHYKRARKWGDPNTYRPVRDEAERFWGKVDKSGDCWTWTAGAHLSGYGAFHLTGGASVLAHRYSYESLVGAIPDGLVIDHLCRNRACVNPDHMEPVTNEENLRRGAGYALQNGMRDSCRNGHEYTPENTYVDPSKGTVRCRECARTRDRKRVPRERAA